ncbi:unnamed protein product [Symbiodinium microadriaticum]|nr:unnamed protein product [Symbiodinium microadriaticum]
MRLVGRAATLRPPLRLRNESFLRSTFARAKEFGSQALHVVLDRRVQQGAAAGALSCGAWGGFWGLCNGSVIGCSVGLMAAPFTLGFSVPVLTSMMAWTGLVVGSSAGVGAGLVGGGCAGYLYSVHNTARIQGGYINCLCHGAAKAAHTETPAAAAYATVTLVPATLKSAGICSGGTRLRTHQRKFDANSPEQDELTQEAPLEQFSLNCAIGHVAADVAGDAYLGVLTCSWPMAILWYPKEGNKSNISKLPRPAEGGGSLAGRRFVNEGRWNLADCGLIDKVRQTLCLIVLVDMVNFGMVFPLLPSIAERFGVDAAAAGSSASLNYHWGMHFGVLASYPRFNSSKDWTQLDAPFLRQHHAKIG